MCCYCGALDTAEKVIAPLKSFGPPAQNLLGPMPYIAQQCLFDAAFPAGSYYYTKGAFLADLTDEIIEVFAEYGATKPSPLSGILVQTALGAASRVASDAMAFAHRKLPYAPVIVSQWLDPTDSEKNVAWARGCWKALESFAGASSPRGQPPAEGRHLPAAMSWCNVWRRRPIGGRVARAGYHALGQSQPLPTDVSRRMTADVPRLRLLLVLDAAGWINRY
jgi:hypothetical protein